MSWKGSSPGKRAAALSSTTNTLQPTYAYGDRFYLDMSDKRPNGDFFVYWDGLGIAFAETALISSSNPMVKLSGSGANLDSIPLTDLIIMGRVRGRMALN